jgi:integrator complex subunit 4
MIFNAAKNLPPMLSLLPDLILKHYDYLRDTMPHLVPHLPIGNQSEMALGGTSGSHQFLETLLANLKATCFAKTARQALLQAAQENLDRLSSIDPELLGTALFSRDILAAQSLMEQLQINVMNNRVPSRETLKRLINCCLRLQNLFSHLTIDDLFLVKQICLKASALNLVLVVKDKSQSALSPCQLLLHVASNTQAFLSQNPTFPLDSFSIALLSYLDSISDPKPGRISRGILPLIQNANMWQNLTPINFKIKMCRAKIVEPEEVKAMENVIKVTAGLIAALPINVEIEHLEEHQKQDLRIKVKYPDQAIHIVVPRMRDLKKMINENGNEVENCWRLRSNVLLSHSTWTEMSQVELSVCLAVKPSHELELCKPIKISFAPKPIRKGI